VQGNRRRRKEKSGGAATRLLVGPCSKEKEKREWLRNRIEEERERGETDREGRDVTGRPHLFYFFKSANWTVT
jgi:hypothetical protein